MSILENKLCEVQRLLAEWRWRTVVSCKELESLLGKLHFMSRCMRAGRVMVNHLLQCLRGMPRQGRQELTPQARLDIKWWYKFLPEFNGVMVLTLVEVVPEGMLEMDSTMTRAEGVCGDSYFTVHFPETVLQRAQHIAQLELLAIMLALKLWGNTFHASTLRVKCDNIWVLQALHSGAARDEFMAETLREIAYLLTLTGSVIKAEYIPSKQNVLPDLLSRWDSQEACKKFQQLTADRCLACTTVLDKLFELTHVHHAW